MCMDIRVCVCVCLYCFSLCVCVCVTVTGSYQDKAQPAAQGCRGHVGEGEGGVGEWLNNIHPFPFFSFPLFLLVSLSVSNICLHPSSSSFIFSSLLYPHGPFIQIMFGQCHSPLSAHRHNPHTALLVQLSFSLPPSFSLDLLSLCLICHHTHLPFLPLSNYHFPLFALLSIY